MSCECDHSTLEIILRDVVECERVRAPCTVDIVGQGPQGIPGVAGTSEVLGEIPTGDVNGVNTTFTTSADFTAIAVYRNGVRQMEDEDYTVVDAHTFQFIGAPFAGDLIQVDYNLATPPPPVGDTGWRLVTVVGPPRGVTLQVQNSLNVWEDVWTYVASS